MNHNEPIWWITRDGDKTCLDMYERHYSCYKYADKRRRKLFCGPGEKLVLRTGSGDAFFVWKKFKDDCLYEPIITKRGIVGGERIPQSGINCAVFRNENGQKYQSSELIRQADAIADCIWPGQRHYTYVDPKSVGSRNPGFCFLVAGWRRCGITKGGLLILDRIKSAAGGEGK